MGVTPSKANVSRDDLRQSFKRPKLDEQTLARPVGHEDESIRCFRPT